MGRWRPETSPPYGEQERWIPEFRGDWPADATEIPCPACFGELTRRSVSPDAVILEREQRRRDQATKVAQLRGEPVPEFPPLPAPRIQWVYRQSCYRSAHRLEEGTRTVELTPAARTADWTDR